MKEESLPEIKSLRVKKWSYEKIGEKLGFSKQRVHQIYKSYTKLPSLMIRTIRIQLARKCSVCGIKNNLEIHHKKGRANNIENLVIYCRGHHLEEESRLYRLGKPTEKNRIPEKECPICGKNFRGTMNKVFLCSRKCFHKYFSINHPIIHSTRSAYNNRGCRCNLCRKASTDYYRIRRAVAY